MGIVRSLYDQPDSALLQKLKALDKARADRVMAAYYQRGNNKKLATKSKQACK